MKLLIGTSGLSTGGGIGTYVDEISKWFYSKGNEILVCYLKEKSIKPGKFPYPVYISEYSSNQSKDRELEVIRKLNNKINEFSPDVIINNDNIYISGLFPSIDPNCVRISVVHGFRKNFGWDHHKIINSAAVYNHEYIDWIVSISDVMAKETQFKWKLPDDQVKLLYNGLSSYDEYFVPFEERSKVKELNFFFAGGSKREKGADVLLRALGKIVNKTTGINFKIYWAGEMQPKFENKIRKLSKRVNVKLLGRLEHNKLLQTLGNCHYLLLPSRVEGCPMLLLEAMSLGVVPIVSDCDSAMREIISDVQVGKIINVGSDKSLFEAITQIKTISDDWEIQAIKSKNYFLNKLHIDKYGEKLLKLVRTPRPGRLKQKSEFPPEGLVHYHRERYGGSKLSIRNLRLRWFNITGNLEKL